MDMGIHTDARFAETKRHDKIGGFPPDPFERKELVDGVRYNSAIFHNKLPRQQGNLIRLGAIKAGGVDQPGYFVNGETRHFLRRLGPGKYPGRSESRHLILGTQRDDTGNKNLEGTAVALGNNGYRRSLPVFVFFAQGRNNVMNIIRFHRVILSYPVLLRNTQFFAGCTFLSHCASIRGMNIDLHIHSNYSDGAFTPAELVALAAHQNVTVIAIADHDSVAGIEEATTAGADAGVEVLPAVELSVQFKEWSDVHLLGYGIDWRDDTFLDNLNRFRLRREGRNEEILERVNESLSTEGRNTIPLESVLAFARDVIGRPHIARALLELGYVDSVEDAFRRYLVPCNVPKIYWPMAEAIAEIHRIGGVAVLAHPTSIIKDMTQLGPIIADLQKSGLDGIEVYNNMGWPLEIEFLRRTALDCGLLATAGSDFHGIEEGLEIGKGREGIRFDSALLAPLYERLQHIRTAQGQNA